MLLSNGEIGSNHFGAQLASGDVRDPSQLFARFGRIAEQCLYLGGTEVSRVNPNDDVSRLYGRAGLVCNRVDDTNLIEPVALKAQSDSKFSSAPPHKLANRMLAARCNNEIVWVVLLEN